MVTATPRPERIVVLSTVSAGIDTLAELLRHGVRPFALVGLHPDSASPHEVSGWIDVAEVAQRFGLKSLYVRSYAMTRPDDRAAFEALRPDLVLVTGWQRLVPEWLIALPQYGVLGGHGSPDGIHGGRGRSPQTWALLLGCRTFELSLFRITAGIDDGPVLATRSFTYTADDDIRTSYFRASLAMADMIIEMIDNPAKLLAGVQQPCGGFYYPQRKPDDGWADWSLAAAQVAKHCRALTHPYPGLGCRSSSGDVIRIWRCQPFDSEVAAEPGVVGPCFVADEFLVQCLDGRLLVRDWSSDSAWRPAPGELLEGQPWNDQLAMVVDRHVAKFPDLPVSPRILQLLGRSS
jgi:methionyl-tRNA formyltransferase